jgi:hypothetical protein
VRQAFKLWDPLGDENIIARRQSPLFNRLDGEGFQFLESIEQYVRPMLMKPQTPPNADDHNCPVFGQKNF